MAYNSKVVQKVLTDFANKEKTAMLTAQKRRNALYGELPELRRAEAGLAQTHKEIIESVMNPGNDIRIKLENIKNRNKNLQEQRKLILEHNGYPGNYTDPVYDCAGCGDTGYKNGVMCGCLKRALAIESANESGFGEVIKNQNFKNFSLAYYEKSNSAGAEPGAYEQMVTVFESCRNYAKKFGQPNSVKHLLFMGRTGLGKTHMSSAIAGEVIKKGYDVYYNSAQSILYSFEKERFSRYGEFDHDIIERYMTCDLLIIDDLGTEYTGSMYASSLYTLINIRLAENKAMIISTNLSYDDISKRYDERVVSRMAGEFSLVYFVGDDVRLQK